MSIIKLSPVLVSYVLIFNLPFVLCNTYHVMFFSKPSFRLQNACSVKVQSFIPKSRILGQEMLPQMFYWIFLKVLLTAKSDNRVPKTEPMYDPTDVNLRTWISVRRILVPRPTEPKKSLFYERNSWSFTNFIYKVWKYKVRPMQAIQYICMMLSTEGLSNEILF